MQFARNALDIARLQIALPAKDRCSPLTSRLALALVLAVVVWVGSVEYLDAGANVQFEIYGINSLFASVAASILCVLMFSPRHGALGVTRLLAMLTAGAYVLGWLANRAYNWASQALIPQEWQMQVWLAGWFLPVFLGLWTGCCAWRIFRDEPSIGRPVARGISFGLVLWSSALLLPNWPVFTGSTFSRSTANVYELVSAYRSARGEAASVRDEEEERRTIVELAQPALMERAIAGLAPREPGRGNVFVLGVAGWGREAVFAREASRSIDILGTKFNSSARSIMIANDRRDDFAHPLATVQNLTTAVRGIASKMDLDQDVLLIAMTSHGSQQGFAFEREQHVRRVLHPAALKLILDEAGVKNRIILVSACYSGTFVPAFSDANSMIITAAAADRTSFGCSDTREWTYFGDAFFANGLKERATLSAAFVHASELVSGWESAQNYPHSNPQIYVGEALRTRFPELIGVPVNSTKVTQATN